MYVIPTEEEREKYEHLYSPARYVDVYGTINVYGYESNHFGWLDNRDIVGNNFSYEASATPNSTFGLGAANIDTLTLDVKYDSDHVAVLDKIDTEESGTGGTNSNAEFYFEIGYGATSPYATGTHTDTCCLVPLGTFVLQDKACKVGENKYTLKLQSLMCKFDRDLPPAFTPNLTSDMQEILERRGITEPDFLALLEVCCNWCKRTGYWDPQGTWHAVTWMHLSSKMDPTTPAGQAYLATIPNITGVSFNIPTNHEYLTFRDIIKDVATLCCSFATTDEVGNLLLIPFTPMQNSCLRLNDGSETNMESPAPAYDICTKYLENLGAFKIREIRCRATEEQDGETIEVNYDAPVQSQDFPGYYDITGTKLLKYISDKQQIQQMVMNIYNLLAYEINTAPNYDPVPFDIETASGDWRLRLGDWVCARSNFKDRLGNNFFCKGQIMRMSLKMSGRAKYQCFTLPTDNDRNASKRQTGAEGDYPTDEGGEAPPPPEPPVVIFDNYGQWIFGDEDAIREEYEAVGEPGKTYYVSTYGQWSFGNTPL